MTDARALSLRNTILALPAKWVFSLLIHHEVKPAPALLFRAAPGSGDTPKCYLGFFTLTLGTRGTPCSARRKARSALPSALISRLSSFLALRSLTMATLAALDSYAALRHAQGSFSLAVCSQPEFLDITMQVRTSDDARLYGTVI